MYNLENVQGESNYMGEKKMRYIKKILTPWSREVAGIW